MVPRMSGTDQPRIVKGWGANASTLVTRSMTGRRKTAAEGFGLDVPKAEHGAVEVDVTGEVRSGREGDEPRGGHRPGSTIRTERRAGR